MKKRIITLLCTMLMLAGCGNANATTSGSPAVQQKEETEKITYASKIEKEECSLCSDHKKSLLSIYGNQINVGIIDINTMEISPVAINRYTDQGKLVEELATSSSTTTNSFGEDGMFTMVSANSDRGYANATVSFPENSKIDKSTFESSLCQDCIDKIMDNAWDNPYGIGVINFETFEVHLFEKNTLGFSFDDFYIDIDHRDSKDDTNRQQLNLLIFYCPLRYE